MEKELFGRAVPFEKPIFDAIIWKDKHESNRFPAAQNALAKQYFVLVHLDIPYGETTAEWLALPILVWDAESAAYYSNWQ